MKTLPYVALAFGLFFIATTITGCELAKQTRDDFKHDVNRLYR